MSEQEEIKKLRKGIRKGLIKDFNALYVKEYTTTWEIERLVRETEIGIMSLDNTMKALADLKVDMVDKLTTVPMNWEMKLASTANYDNTSSKLTDYGMGYLAGRNDQLAHTKQAIGE